MFRKVSVLAGRRLAVAALCLLASACGGRQEDVEVPQTPETEAAVQQMDQMRQMQEQRMQQYQEELQRRQGAN